MIFFQDNDLEKIDIIKQYNDLITLGKYTKANDYIKLHENVYGYFSDYFNAIENRIHSLQKHLKTKEQIKKQYVCFNASDDQKEPDIDEGMLWL